MTDTKILICYSNPSDTTQLRLDIEHSNLEKLLKNMGRSPMLMKRLHATTVEDLISELSEKYYEILQFSGHGSEDGIYLENPDRSGSVLFDMDSLRRALLISSQSLRAVILTCCYSSEMRMELANCVPYLISVVGPTADTAAIKFSQLFYQIYLREERSSVERAVQTALLMLGNDSGIDVVINRRGLLNQDGKLIVQTINKYNDGPVILLDLTAVRPFVDALDSDLREQFLESICTSMRAHLSMFLHKAMERIAIPFGEFIGIFTWKNEIDPVICEQAFRLPNSISEVHTYAIMQYLSRYSTLAGLEYRSKNEKNFHNKVAIVTNDFRRFKEWSEILMTGAISSSMNELAPTAFKLAISVVRANLSEAELALREEDYPRLIILMEIALTTIHNFILQLLKKVDF